MQIHQAFSKTIGITGELICRSYLNDTLNIFNSIIYDKIIVSVNK